MARLLFAPSLSFFSRRSSSCPRQPSLSFSSEPASAAFVPACRAYFAFSQNNFEEGIINDGAAAGEGRADNKIEAGREGKWRIKGIELSLVNERKDRELRRS